MVSLEPTKTRSRTVKHGATGKFMKHICLASLLTCVRGSGGPAAGAPPRPRRPTPTPTPSGTTATAVSIPMGASSLTTTAYVPDSSTWLSGQPSNDQQRRHRAQRDLYNNLFFSPAMVAGCDVQPNLHDAGTFPYCCTLHVGMTGTVTVHNSWFNKGATTMQTG